MRYMAIAETDIGISKTTNQDSVLIRHALSSAGEVCLAVVCDGMGGLAKGELASATVIRAFSDWFDRELPFELNQLDLHVIGGKWSLMLKELNNKIMNYGEQIGAALGTTFSGILMVGDAYVFAHVGDSRIYHFGETVHQLTVDQTFVAREVMRGTMTPEQAKTDKRRNLLLQCVGASKTVEPQVVCGVAQKGIYMLCSDGFRHVITEGEMKTEFSLERMADKNAMHSSARKLIELVKARQERDNISVALIKAE